MNRGRHSSFTTRFPQRDTEKPRTVRGGVKLRGKDAPKIEGWVGQRWLRLFENAAAAEALLGGLDYSKRGQTRSIVFEPGMMLAKVQGRAPRAYEVVIKIPTFSHEVWEQGMAAMTEQAIYAAKLLAGEMPRNIEDLFAPLGVRLFPAEADDVEVSCSCKEDGPWCKHVCCLGYLAGEILDAEPFEIFSLRGMAIGDVSERLRQRRAVAASAGGAAPAYTQRPLPDEALNAPALELCLDEFWSAGKGLDELETLIEPPVVSHPLLRRLGPSPFENAKFPLVGLLATCYDTMSKWVIERSAGEGADSDEGDVEAEDFDGEGAPRL